MCEDYAMFKTFHSSPRASAVTPVAMCSLLTEHKKLSFIVHVSEFLTANGWGDTTEKVPLLVVLNNGQFVFFLTIEWKKFFRTQILFLITEFGSAYEKMYVYLRFHIAFPKTFITPTSSVNFTLSWVLEKTMYKEMCPSPPSPFHTAVEWSSCTL